MVLIFCTLISLILTNSGLQETYLAIWNFETDDGKSIKKAFDWLIPFVKNEKSWTYQQIKPIKFDQTVKILRFAAQKYRGYPHPRPG